MYTLNKGWISQANRHISENFNQRPEPVDIDSIIIHSISLPPGQYGTGDIGDLFTNRLDWSRHEFYRSIEGLKVSAHFLIDRQGRLTQFVNIHDRAWHAGQSSYQGRE